MVGDAFVDWASGPGGLSSPSVRSYASYLNGIEAALGVDVAADWDRSQSRDTEARLLQADEINPKTRDNYLSGLRKYAEFRSLTGA